MKSKKRHQSSSDESEESEESLKSITSSESESDGSSSEHKSKKKRKHQDTSSDSESDSDSKHKRSKKRKHKKKKKHGKKKKHSESVRGSDSEEAFSLSDGEISPKKRRKHKHKHSKRARESSVSDDDHSPKHKRLHSVVKEQKNPPVENTQETRTHYQRNYRQDGSDEYDREQEVQRFYRGSSKDRRTYYQENAHNRYEKEQDKRYYDQEKYERNKEKYKQTSHYENDHKQKDYDDYKRTQRYEEHRSQSEYHIRHKEDYYVPKNEYMKKEYKDNRGYAKYSPHEERQNKRREFEENKPYREKYPPALMDLPCDREYFEKRLRNQEDRYSGERRRDFHGEKPPKFDKRPSVHHREYSRSKSPKERHKEDERKADYRDERHRNGRDKQAGERPARKYEAHQSRAGQPAPRERKSRFTNDNDKKEYTWGKTEVKKESDKVDKEKPNFGLSGKLTADVNTVNGVVIKYTEPDDARQPKRRWRFYPFKGDKELPILYIHRQSSFLIGRDKKVVDIILEHPSVSKQHAALQYRAAPFTRPDGSRARRVRPYIIDLESANGTFVNNKKIEARRYVELLERDVVKFGFSQREYVLLHENSKDDALDDDQPEDMPGVTTTHQIKHEKRIKQEIDHDG